MFEITSFQHKQVQHILDCTIGDPVQLLQLGIRPDLPKSSPLWHEAQIKGATRSPFKNLHQVNSLKESTQRRFAVSMLSITLVSPKVVANLKRRVDVRMRPMQKEHDDNLNQMLLSNLLWRTHEGKGRTADRRLHARREHARLHELLP